MSAANPVLALVLFAVGASLLWGGWNQWNRLRRVQRLAVRSWQYADTAFSYRREMLPRLLIAVRTAGVPETEAGYRALWEISQAAKVAEAGGNRNLLMDAEQKISRHLFYLLEACEKSRGGGLQEDVLAALCDEARDREQHINAVREGWNDAAYAIRVYRHTFPTFLLARVLFPYDLPLFVGTNDAPPTNV